MHFVYKSLYAEGWPLCEEMISSIYKKKKKKREENIINFNIKYLQETLTQILLDHDFSERCIV